MNSVDQKISELAQEMSRYMMLGPGEIESHIRGVAEKLKMYSNLGVRNFRIVVKPDALRLAVEGEE